MSGATISSGNAAQYGDSRKLAARARLHTDYTICETPWFEWVAARLPLASRSAVLDVGCGPGWFWAQAGRPLPAGLRLTLADLSPGMIAEAEGRCRDLGLGAVETVVADADALPFADATFDGVLAMHMLYHLPDPAAGITEMVRVLRPGGWLAVTTNGVGNMRELYALTEPLGSDPVDPSAVAFGLDVALDLMRARLVDVRIDQHPARLRITEPLHVFEALTSYPPGDTASRAALAGLEAAIAQAFTDGAGVLSVAKESALLLGRKPA